MFKKRYKKKENMKGVTFPPTKFILEREGQWKIIEIIARKFSLAPDLGTLRSRAALSHANSNVPPSLPPRCSRYHLKSFFLYAKEFTTLPTEARLPRLQFFPFRTSSAYFTPFFARSPVCQRRPVSP